MHYGEALPPPDLPLCSVLKFDTEKKKKICLKKFEEGNLFEDYLFEEDGWCV